MLNKNKKAYKVFFYGIVFICILGSLLHFAYDLFNRSLIAGLFFPVNESVWEHFKLVYFPTIIWFIITYFLLKAKYKKVFFNCVISCSISIFINIITIIFIHYSYTGIIGKSSMIVDIGSFFLGTFLGQNLAFKVFIKNDKKPIFFIIAIVFLILLFISFIVFTTTPIRIPLFFDKESEIYGRKM